MSIFNPCVGHSAALILSIAATTAHGFPQDGLFFQGLTCPAEGFAAGEARSASLSFPTLCLSGTSCDLSNPINVRDMDQIFLYDGACSSDGDDFAARRLIGEASGDGRVVVYDNTAHTYSRCEP